MPENYSIFFALLKEINSKGAELDRKEVVLQFTGNKTDSLSSLSDDGYNQLCDHMQNMLPKKTDFRLDKARKAIISQFRSIGKTAVDAKVWAEKYGVKGVKRKFNQYTGQELYLLLQNAKKMKADTTKSLTRKLTDRPNIICTDDIGEN